MKTRYLAAWLAAICVAGIAQTAALAAGDDGPLELRVTKDIPYVENGHARNKLDVYLPAEVSGKLPVVLYIHGGAWLAGDKEGAEEFLPLIRHGYALAGCNYRYSTQAPFPAQIEDCKAAVRWLRANAQKYHFDPDQVAVIGSSAGGHLVSLLGTTADEKKFEGAGGNAEQSSRVQAVVDIFGPSDLAAMPDMAKLDSPIAKLLGATPADHKDIAAAASPITYVSAKSAPFLMLHGTKDDLVPIAQSEVFAEALKKAGVEATLVKVEGAGHGGPQFNDPKLMQQVIEFLDRHLKPAAAAK